MSYQAKLAYLSHTHKPIAASKYAARNHMQKLRYELVEIGRSDVDWAVLYLDKADGRYWELIYPGCNQQGGAVPSLELRSIGEVTDKYKIFIPE
jgi:hypothetical protein